MTARLEKKWHGCVTHVAGDCDERREEEKRWRMAALIMSLVDCYWAICKRTGELAAREEPKPLHERCMRTWRMGVKKKRRAPLSFSSKRVDRDEISQSAGIRS